MYIAAGQGQTFPGDKLLMSTWTSCHFGHLLQIFGKNSLQSDFIQFFLWFYTCTYIIWSFWKPSRGYWKQFLLPCLFEHSQNLPVAEGNNLPRGKVSPHLNPHVRFHFYFMIKELRNAWLFEVSESSSRGYWKNLLHIIIKGSQFQFDLCF